MQIVDLEYDSDKIRRCPECGSTELYQDYERGEITCGRCGLVLDDNYIDQGQEWRMSSSEKSDSRSRTGLAMTNLLHDRGLSTGISVANSDSYGRPIPPRNRSQLYRMRKWQTRVAASNPREGNLMRALQELERMAPTLGIPAEIRESSAAIYRKATNQSAFLGRHIKCFVAGSIYAACRMAGVPRTVHEIAVQTGIDEKALGRCYRFLSRNLGLEVPISKPSDFVSNFCSELGVSGKTRELSLEILDRATRNMMTSGKKPTAIAASAIYLAAQINGEAVTQASVAKVTGVSVVTIRGFNKRFAEKFG